MNISDVKAFLDANPLFVLSLQDKERTLRIARDVLKLKARSDTWKAYRIFKRCAALQFMDFLAEKRSEELRPCGEV